MIKTYTQDDVIKFVYHELSERESIEEAIFCDEELMDDFISFKNLQSNLSKIQRTPSNQSINRILNYSKMANTYYSCK